MRNIFGLFFEVRCVEQVRSLITAAFFVRREPAQKTFLRPAYFW
jgi:hypothetical protein